MNTILVQAIEQRRRLRCVYHAKPRLIEPQCYGVGRPGHELLRVHQPRGGSEREPLFRVAEMEALELLDEVFIEPGPHYRKNDSAMVTIYAQL